MESQKGKQNKRRERAAFLIRKALLLELADIISVDNATLLGFF